MIDYKLVLLRKGNIFEIIKPASIFYGLIAEQTQRKYAFHSKR